MKVKYIASETVKASLSNGVRVIKQGDVLDMTESEFEFFKPVGFEAIVESIKEQVIESEKSEEKEYKKSKRNRR